MTADSNSITADIKPAGMLTRLVVDSASATTDGKRECKLCLFLGAGASQSSGILTAAQLVEEWIKSLREIAISDGAISTEAEFPQWYEHLKRKLSHGGSLSNDYAFLIEHFHPTSALRQAFIESEIDNKYPFLGYMYLAMLVHQNYFNVVFTTNFDDLINDALYRYVDMRPLVCSFDSSVNSIRIASHRPKIIKLHGNYLFDNLKNTSSEVRNLTVNMDRKFKEFCKEYGLIVIGYSGEDDSVMDIIREMLKDGDYLKMGLHWCLREGESIPECFRSSIGLSDRLHFYRIKSFDIFMSDCAERATLMLPIEVTNPKRSMTINKLREAVKQQGYANYSKYMIADADHILKSLQREEEDIALRIAAAHMTGKRIQIENRSGDNAAAEQTFEECVAQCDAILADPSGLLEPAERAETIAIKGVAFIGKAKLEEEAGANKEKVAKTLTTSLELLDSAVQDASQLKSSSEAEKRRVYVRIHFNLACVRGKLAAINKKSMPMHWKIAKEHLWQLRECREAIGLLEKARNPKDEPDLNPFRKQNDFGRAIGNV